jgi:hypothetical protein
VVARDIARAARFVSRSVGAARFELATFRPPAGQQSVSMRPWASPASPSSPGVDDLDASDTAVGTKVVLRSSRTQAGIGRGC